MNAAKCDAIYKRTVLLKCYDALATAGFTRYRKEGVDWPLESGFHCWVGLNNNLEKEYVQINPFVGVHVVPIMKLTCIEVGKYQTKYSRSIATYALHMGELEIAADEPIFRFTRQTDVEAEAARLACLYSSVGLAYAKSIASYERLLPLLQSRVPMAGGYPERVAACLYLMDRKDEARSFVEEFLNKEWEYFEGFAVPFLKLISNAPDTQSSEISQP